MSNEYIKNLKRENQNIREVLNDLEKNRDTIALHNNGEFTDYYSFLQGFDYVLDRLKLAIKWMEEMK